MFLKWKIFINLNYKYTVKKRYFISTTQFVQNNNFEKYIITKETCAIFKLNHTNLKVSYSNIITKHNFLNYVSINNISCDNILCRIITEIQHQYNIKS